MSSIEEWMELIGQAQMPRPAALNWLIDWLDSLPGLSRCLDVCYKGGLDILYCLSLGLTSCLHICSTSWHIVLSWCLFQAQTLDIDVSRSCSQSWNHKFYLSWTHFPKNGHILGGVGVICLRIPGNLVSRSCLIWLQEAGWTLTYDCTTFYFD